MSDEDEIVVTVKGVPLAEVQTIVYDDNGTPTNVTEEWKFLRSLEFIHPDIDDYYGEVYAAKTLVADRREVCVINWGGFGAALSVGPPGVPCPLEYDEQWLYQRRDWALEAFAKWNGEGEPERWFRQAGTPRRRTDGDPSKEYEQW